MGENGLTDDARQTRTWAKLEEEETEALCQQLAGQAVEPMVYNLPFATKGGRSDCGYAGCKYAAEGKPHNHVIGISALGLDELARIYEGIAAIPMRWRLVVDRGERFWEVAVLAVDLITGAIRVSVYRQKDDAPRAQGDARGSFAFSIAQHKAKRNAIAEILPLGIKAGIRDMAKKGKLVLTEESARALLMPYLSARAGRPAMVNPLQLLIAAASGQAPGVEPEQVVGQGSAQGALQIPGFPTPSLPSPMPPAVETPIARPPEKAAAPKSEPASKPATKAEPKPAPKAESPESNGGSKPWGGPDSSIEFGSHKGLTWRQVLDDDRGFVERLGAKNKSWQGAHAREALKWIESEAPAAQGLAKPESPPQPTATTGPDPFEAISKLAEKHGWGGADLDYHADLALGKPYGDLSREEAGQLLAGLLDDIAAKEAK